MAIIIFILKGFHDSLLLVECFQILSWKILKKIELAVLFLLEISSTSIGKRKLLIYLARTCNSKLPCLFIYLAASNVSRVKFLSIFL